MKSKNFSIDEIPLRPDNLANLIGLIQDGTINGKIAKDIFEDIVLTNEGAKKCVERKGLIQISDTKAIEEIVEKILNNNQDQIKVYLSGKEQVFGFFVGQVMKEMKGKANPKIVNEILRSKIEIYKNN
jgi:aspartyl-tRNA(Asn)/glutamyl-tRNA(Gln) amidotransferase subunit B